MLFLVNGGPVKVFISYFRLEKMALHMKIIVLSLVSSNEILTTISNFSWKHLNHMRKYVLAYNSPSTTTYFNQSIKCLDFSTCLILWLVQKVVKDWDFCRTRFLVDCCMQACSIVHVQFRCFGSRQNKSTIFEAHQLL